MQSRVWYFLLISLLYCPLVPSTTLAAGEGLPEQAINPPVAAIPPNLILLLGDSPMGACPDTMKPYLVFDEDSGTLVPRNAPYRDAAFQESCLAEADEALQADTNRAKAKLLLEMDNFAQSISDAYIKYRFFSDMRTYRREEQQLECLDETQFARLSEAQEDAIVYANTAKHVAVRMARLLDNWGIHLIKNYDPFPSQGHEPSLVLSRADQSPTYEMEVDLSTFGDASFNPEKIEFRSGRGGLVVNLPSFDFDLTYKKPPQLMRDHTWKYERTRSGVSPTAEEAQRQNWEARLYPNPEGMELCNVRYAIWSSAPNDGSNKFSVSSSSINDGVCAIAKVGSRAGYLDRKRSWLKVDMQADYVTAGASECQRKRLGCEISEQESHCAVDSGQSQSGSRCYSHSECWHDRVLMCVFGTETGGGGCSGPYNSEPCGVCGSGDY